jgi:hypothetical protein
MNKPLCATVLSALNIIVGVLALIAGTVALVGWIRTCTAAAGFPGGSSREASVTFWGGVALVAWGVGGIACSAGLLSNKVWGQRLTLDLGIFSIAAFLILAVNALALDRWSLKALPVLRALLFIGYGGVLVGCMTRPRVKAFFHASPPPVPSTAWETDVEAIDMARIAEWQARRDDNAPCPAAFLGRLNMILGLLAILAAGLALPWAVMAPGTYWLGHGIKATPAVIQTYAKLGSGVLTLGALLLVFLVFLGGVFTLLSGYGLRAGKTWARPATKALALTMVLCGFALLIVSGLTRAWTAALWAGAIIAYAAILFYFMHLSTVVSYFQHIAPRERQTPGR